MKIYEWYNTSGLRQFILIEDIVMVQEDASVMLTKRPKLIIYTKHTVRVDIDFDDVDTMKEEFIYLRDLLAGGNRNINE